MDWSDVKSFISKAAPILGSTLGPAGTVVGGLISSALGTENSPDAVMEVLQSSPDALLKLKQLEITHAEFLANLTAQNNGQQLQIDLAAEQSASLLQKWRDGLGWTCVTGVAYSFVVQPLLATTLATLHSIVILPKLDSASLMGLVTILLGAVGSHVYENVKDVYHV